MRIREANERDLAQWDDRVAASFNGTIFHRRRFLAYHGDRFAGRERFLVLCDGDTPVAQIALTVEDVAEGRIARSPYGASYGGVVFLTQPSFTQSTAAVAALDAWLRSQDVRRFAMTPPISVCASEPLDGFAFALLAGGYRSINRDLSMVVRLAADTPVAERISTRARRMARKAEAAGVTIERNAFDDFWRVMEKTYAKHGVPPTHTKDEFARLMTLLPEDVTVDVAYGQDGAPIAGIGFVAVNRRVTVSFYLCQDPARQQEQGLSLLLLRALERSADEGFAAFDLGTSTVNMVANDGVMTFKENFTKLALFRETFEWRAEEYS